MLGAETPTLGSVCAGRIFSNSFASATCSLTSILCEKNHKEHIHLIGGLGELERFILPPVTGRSASFRLRFRFVRVVRAVRAGEAKLRGRMTIVVLNAGPPGCEYPGFARGFLLNFCAQARGF